VASLFKILKQLQCGRLDSMTSDNSITTMVLNAYAIAIILTHPHYAIAMALAHILA